MEYLVNLRKAAKLRGFMGLQLLLVQNYDLTYKKGRRRKKLKFGSELEHSKIVNGCPAYFSSVVVVSSVLTHDLFLSEIEFCHNFSFEF